MTITDQSYAPPMITCVSCCNDALKINAHQTKGRTGKGKRFRCNHCHTTKVHWTRMKIGHQARIGKDLYSHTVSYLLPCRVLKSLFKNGRSIMHPENKVWTLTNCTRYIEKQLSDKNGI